MSDQIIGSTPSISEGADDVLKQWLKTPLGAYVQAWDLVHFKQEIETVFGFHALQLGSPSMTTLSNSRIPHQWLAVSDVESKTPFSLACKPDALPFFESTIDLITLPHTLDMDAHPNRVLSEVARVLVPEGRVAIAGFNSHRLWGLSRESLPQGSTAFGYKELRHSLEAFDLEIESISFGGHVLKAMEHWCPSMGTLYFVVAVKRVRALNIKPQKWKFPKLYQKQRARLALKKSEKHESS